MPQQTTITQSLKDELKNVPQKIRDWFSLEKVTDLIINLNSELGLESKLEPGGKLKPASEKAAVIPLLLLRLQIKDLEPQNFTQELSSQLNVDYETAKSIAREIKKRILEPISQVLLRWEVDINRIPIGGLSLAEIKPPTKPEPEVKIEKELKPAPFPITPTTPTPPTPVVPTTPVPAEKPFDKAQDKPFILHQETESKPVGEKKREAPPIIGWFRKEKPKKTETPIKVELETPGLKTEEKKEPIIAKTEAPKQKVVHYREVEMPTPFGRPEAQPPKTEAPAPIETEKPAKPQEEPGKPQEPKVISLDSFGVVKEKEVKLDGNTINLKDNKPNS